MIVRAKAVVTMDGAPIADGAVRIRGDRIMEVGRASEFADRDETTIQLGQCALVPGLINAHCHLDYTCLRGKIPPPASFTDWIRAINAEKAKLTADDYAESVAAGFREAKRFGTTGIVNLEAMPELLGSLAPVPTWWCAELIDVTGRGVADAILREAEKKKFGLAPHALFTASAKLYRRCQTAVSLLTTHLAESREEMEMFRDGTGPLFDFLRALGRADCGRATPVATFLEIVRDPSTPLRCAEDDRGAARWLVAHLNEFTEGDFDLLKALPRKFSIAHCPRSHAYFRHSPFAFERLSKLGFNICLATDSLASNDDLSLFAEMRAFQKAHRELSAEKILKMVTTNPARALGRAKEHGKIVPGFLADLIAVPLRGSGDIYDQVIAFEEEVRWMMIGGAVA